MRCRWVELDKSYPRKGTGALIPRFATEIENVQKTELGLKTGTIQSFKRAAILTSTEGNKRFFLLAPGPENQFELNGFYVCGKFQIIDRINNSRVADEAYKTFLPA